MLGVVIGRGLEADLEEEYSIEDAIKYFNNALHMLDKKFKDKDLEATLLNAKAYAITLKPRKKVEDIIEAEGCLKELEKIIPYGRWGAHFIDTKACIFYLQAFITKNASKKIEYIEKAIKLSKEAVELSKEHHFPRFKINLYTKNLRRHEKFKNDLKGGY